MILDLTENEWHSILLSLRYNEEGKRVKDPDFQRVCNTLHTKIAGVIKSAGEMEYQLIRQAQEMERRPVLRLVDISDLPPTTEETLQELETVPLPSEKPGLPLEQEVEPKPQTSIPGFLARLLFG